MATYALAPIFAPQYVANSGAAPLVFAPAGGAVVPANYNYQISVLHVANNGSTPATLQLWRVPAGASVDPQHIVVPVITIPVGTQTFPYFDVTALWGAVLRAGDAIYTLSDTASALVIQGDGAVIVQ